MRKTKARAAAKTKPQHDRNRALLDLVLASLDDGKAENVVVIDLADKSSIADFMVVATGRSTRQVTTLADHLADKLKAVLKHPVSIEGKTHGDWVLVDGGDVIVHLFRPEVRSFYGLEKMWQAVLDEPAPDAVVEAVAAGA